MHVNRVVHNNVHVAGASNNLPLQVFQVTSLDRLQHLNYIHFCDHLYVLICDLLTLEQKQHCVRVCNDPNFQLTIITATRLVSIRLQPRD